MKTPTVAVLPAVAVRLLLPAVFAVILATLAIARIAGGPDNTRPMELK